MLVILAAGEGKRFHGATHKLNAPLTIDGVTRTVAQHSISRALATSRPTIVVTGAVALDLTPFVDRSPLTHSQGVHSPLLVVQNERWADGQATSIQAAITAALQLNSNAIVIGLADQPFISTETWEALATATGPIVVATYAGKRRNPVRLERSVWSALPTQGDAGARLLFEQRPEGIDEIPCTGSPFDIDTLEELQSWQNKSSTSSR